MGPDSKKRSAGAGATLNWRGRDLPKTLKEWQAFWRGDGPPDRQMEFPFVRGENPLEEEKNGEFEL